MHTKATDLFLVLLVTAAWVVVVFSYSSLPIRMASHWNMEGVVDGYTSRFWGVVLMPSIMSGLLLLYIVIPLIDPLKSNIESFRRSYNSFWIGLELFLLYIFGLTLAWNLGYHFNLTGALLPVFIVALYGLGMLLGRTRRNWFIGIRTPWTLSSDEVWSSTHQLAAMLFKISAASTFAAFLIWGGRTSFFTCISAIMISSLVPVVYSYIAYRNILK